MFRVPVCIAASFSVWVTLLLADPNMSLAKEGISECHSTPAVRVTVGGELFIVPRAYQPFVSPARKNEFDPKWLCQCPTDPPLEADKISLNFNGRRGSIDESSRTVKGIQIFITRGGTSRKTSQRNLSRHAERLQESGQSIRDLPIIGGFFAFPPDHQYPQFYFSQLDKLVSPDGIRIVFWCTEAEIWAPWDHRFGICSTQYSWSDQVSLSYRIWHGAYKLEDFPEVDDAVRRFVAQLQWE